MADHPRGDILNSPQAARLLRDRAAVERLAQSPDAQALMALLERGGGLQAAAQAAGKGDLAPLQGLLSQLLKDPAAAAAAERLQREAGGT